MAKQVEKKLGTPAWAKQKKSRVVKEEDSPKISMRMPDAPDFVSRCARDANGETVFTVCSTIYNGQGCFEPTAADILAQVLNKYFSSAQYENDWKEVVKERTK